MTDNTVVIGVIGLGGRGRGMMANLAAMPDVKIGAICDVIAERNEMAQKTLSDEFGYTAVPAFTDYRELLASVKLDGVLITSSWQTHMTIAIAAMNAGLYVASEVGGACTLDQCWDLVRTSERTGKPCMLLENCCYGREELALLNMVKQGIFGELIHCRCGYEHDLRDEICMGHIHQHYRLDNYQHRNCDNYPMHGALPMGKMLNINNGNRFVSLVSMASKSRGLAKWASDHMAPDSELQGYNFAQGDVVTTIIKCAHGETLVTTLDTCNPRPYSRSGYVQGTKGLWMEENYSIYIEGMSAESHKWESFNPYIEKYDHPIWKWYQSEGIRGGHGGMDYLVLRAYIESIKESQNTPIDVYDFATFCAITPLSEASIATGSSPQAFPDFTNGRYLTDRKFIDRKYALHKVCEA